MLPRRAGIPIKPRVLLPGVYLFNAARLRDRVAAAGGNVQFTDSSASFQPAGNLEDLVRQGESVGLPYDHNADADVQSLQLTTVIGIKGVAAYALHAQILGQEDDTVYAYMHQGLAALSDPTLGLNDWVGLTLKCGEVNLRAMELLDFGNTGAYGHPVPTAVPLGHKKGKCILVSGHDLKDLEEILKQTEGSGWETSGVSRACWTSGSATTPTRLSRSSWRWRMPSSAG